MSDKWSEALFDRIVRQMQGLPPSPPKNGEMVPPGVNSDEMPGYYKPGDVLDRATQAQDNGLKSILNKLGRRYPPGSEDTSIINPDLLPVPAGPRALTAPPSVTPGAGIAPWMALLGDAATPLAAGAAFLHGTEANPPGLADTPPAKPETVIVKKSAADSFGSPVADDSNPPSSPDPSQGAGSILNAATKKSLGDLNSMGDLDARIKARMQERRQIQQQMSAPPQASPQDIKSMEDLQKRVNQRLQERNMIKKGGY